jgi:hypothetical protein
MAMAGAGAEKMANLRAIYERRNKMPDKKNVLIEKLKSFSVDELLEELRVRDKKAEPSKSFKDFDSATIFKVLKAEQKVVYGVDDRQDLFQISDPKILSNADCVVSLFQDTDVVDNGNSTSTLTTQNFGTEYNLCANEPFKNQPSGSFCSGFLVGPDIVATAGHCVNASNVTSIRFVFGFKMLNETTAQTTINNNEIYRGAGLIGRVYTGSDADWALVKLDRVVPNHTIAELRRSGKIPNNQAIHVIGHPCGLPVKFADGSNVRDNNPNDFFVANLDTYGGSSGSPVFNSDTYQVEGILVRGETDFASGNGCYVSLVCPTTGCRGEDCTRTTEFTAFLPLLGTVGSEVKRYDWSSGWSTVEFYEAGGNTYLFLLKQKGGYVHIHRMNADGTVGARVDTRDWSTGWTQAQPFRVGNQLFLFLLKKGNGYVHIHRIIIG